MNIFAGSRSPFSFSSLMYVRDWYLNRLNICVSAPWNDCCMIHDQIFWCLKGFPEHIETYNLNYLLYLMCYHLKNVLYIYISKTNLLTQFQPQIPTVSRPWNVQKVALGNDADSSSGPYRSEEDWWARASLCATPSPEETIGNYASW